MRLTDTQIHTILHTVWRCIGDAEVYLFGSRLDENKHGGDVDLLIETLTPVGRLPRARLQMELENRLHLPIDVVTRARHAAQSPFQQIARAHAVNWNRERHDVLDSGGRKGAPGR